tara:strand:+ start:110 stop:1111 length:1002 start_codon:yes stop_codon:yes gene_type:complete
MEFFDKKEEVLDIELTEYGRELLSQGRWKPAQYAFFDDDILYDSEATPGQQTEKQNAARRRIKYETPALKTQPYVLGAETRRNSHHASITGSGALWTSIQDNSVTFVDTFQNAPSFGQTHLAATNPLGTSDLKTEYAPAWAISMVTNEISSSQDQVGMTLAAQGINLTSSHSGAIVQDIPQLDVVIDYQTFYNATDPDYQGSRYLPLTPQLNAEGIQLFVQDDFLIVEILEENTNYLKENFTIEVYEHAPYSDSASGSVLNQLTFVNNDEEIYHFPQKDQDVEFYMNILVDNEMPPQVAENLGISERVIRASSVRLAVSRDLYGDTENEEGCD